MKPHPGLTVDVTYGESRFRSTLLIDTMERERQRERERERGKDKERVGDGYCYYLPLPVYKGVL